MSNFKARRAEHTHSVNCAAKATITAIENFRESIQHVDVDQSISFTLWLQDNPWYEAREYLDTGTTECICPPCNHSCCDYGAFDGLPDPFISKEN
jgi:hypothetical protein